MGESRPGAVEGPPDDPSAWSHRLPAVVLALAGLAIASWLALFQLGVVGSVWEPLFGDGSRRILTSSVARSLPIPDAALGAAAYAVEAILLLVGGAARWRRLPWAVFATGLVAGAMAIGALVLIAIQAFGFGTGCTLCLTSAALSIVLAAITAPEVAAAFGHVRGTRSAAAAIGDPRGSGRESTTALDGRR